MISIVIPTFERSAMLVEVVSSLLVQPYQRFEILVMDDGSTDDTAARIAQIDDNRVRYFNLGKVGIPGALNAGIDNSDGPYVMILHDHDRFQPELLSEFAAMLDAHPTAAFAFSGYTFFDAEFQRVQESWLLDLPEFIPGLDFLCKVLMPRLNSPVLALSMLRRDALCGEHFDLAAGGCTDVEMWHRLAARGDVAYTRKSLIDVRGRDSTSQFANPAATLTLLTNILTIKKKYLCKVPQGDRKSLERSWRRQATSGALYVAWKAVEARDLVTLAAASGFVSENGTLLGRAALQTLNNLPLSVGLRIMRSARRVTKLVRRSTL